MEDKASKMFLELEMPNLVILGTFALGAMVLILGFLCGRRSAHDKTKNAQLCQVTKLKAPDNVGDTYSNSTTIPGPGGGPGQQKRVKNKKRREIQHHDFSHPWMVGAFKGHTGTVLDLDFSADNKFLASCADDCSLRPEQKRVRQSSSSSSSSSSSGPRRKTRSRIMNHAAQHVAAKASSGSSSSGSSSPSLSDSYAEVHVGVKSASSRRQKKNHSRESKHGNRDEEIIILPSQAREKTGANKENKLQPIVTNSKKLTVPSTNSLAELLFMNYRTFHFANMPDILLVKNLARLQRRLECNLSEYGYPHHSEVNPTLVIIRKRAYRPGKRPTGPSGRNSSLNAEALEFIPRRMLTSISDSSDSGTSSGCSVENSDQESGSDSEKNSDSASAVSSSSLSATESHSILTCARCSGIYAVSARTGNPIRKEKCMFHMGKFRYSDDALCYVWQCCGAGKFDSGCKIAKMHVWSGLHIGDNEMDGFIDTPQPINFNYNHYYGIYGIDCEMCYTRWGLELTRVCVVDVDGHVVYDTFVKPDSEIIDYNTEFSGITADDLVNVTTTLRDVQKDLLEFICSETILVGHALENDLRALKLIHKCVVDSSLLDIADDRSYNWVTRTSLKNLVRQHFQCEIQQGSHNPAEDARAALAVTLSTLLRQLTDEQINNDSKFQQW